MMKRLHKAVFSVLAVATLSMGLFACQADLKSGQTQNEADNIIVALKRYGISADKKEISKNRETSFTVTVGRNKMEEARHILVSLGLPREKLKGIDEICGNVESLIPSPSVDRCKFQLALQNEITKALLQIDGIVEAKININMPEPKMLSDKGRVKPTAAVLLKYIPDEAGRPPFEEKKVREFVANSVDELDYNDVAILATATRQIDLPMFASREGKEGQGQHQDKSKEKKTENSRGSEKQKPDSKKEETTEGETDVASQGGATFMGMDVSSDSARKVKVLMLVGTVLVLVLSAATITTILHLKNVQLQQDRLLKKDQRLRLQGERALPPARTFASASQPLNRPNTPVDVGAENELAGFDSQLGDSNPPFGMN